MESIIAMAQVMEGFEVKEGDPYKQLEALGRAKQTCHGSRDSGLCSSTCKMACYSEHLCAMAHDGIITVGTFRGAMRVFAHGRELASSAIALHAKENFAAEAIAFLHVRTSSSPSVRRWRPSQRFAKLRPRPDRFSRLRRRPRRRRRR